MNLTLLSPFAAILAASIAVPLLIAFYMLKLRRKPERVSTVMFFSPSAQDLEANVPLRMIRPSWLFLLHLLLVALFALALGRPVLEAPFTDGQRIVVLLDRSASMSARSQGAGSPTRYELAQRAATDALDRFERDGFGGELVLIDLSSSPRLRAGPTRSAGEIRAAINRLEPTDGDLDFSAALDLVRSLQAGETDTPVPTALALFSDAGWMNEGSSAAQLAASGFRVIFEPLELDRDQGNAGITALSARRSPDDPDRATVFARVQTVGGRRSIEVACLAAGEVIERRLIRLDPAADTPETTNTTNDRASGGVSFEVFAPEDTLVTLTLPPGDALASDDRASVFLPAPEPLRIGLVRAGGPASTASWILEETARLASRGAVRVIDPASSLDPGRYDLLIYDGVAPTQAPANIPTLAFGVPVPGVLFTADRAPPGGGPPARWERAHPVLRDVALDALTVADVASPALDAADPEASLLRLTPLIEDETGPWLSLLDRRGTRSLVAGFALGRSNWPLTVGFPIFTAAAFDFLTSGRIPVPRVFEPGEPLTMPTSLTGAASLLAPDGSTVQTNEGIEQDTARRDGRLRFGPVERIGVYRAQIAGQRTPIPVALLNAGESAIEAPTELFTSSTPTARNESIEGPVEIWRHIVLIALGLLILEWLIFAVRSRH